MPRWLVVILLLFVGFILLSMATFITLPWIMKSFLPEVGTVLVYEMVDVKPAQDASEAASKTVKALDRRLNPGLRLQLAKVRVIENNRIEVGVYGNDPSSVEKVVELVELNGRLEFHIVANVFKHKAEIEIAKNAPEKSIYINSNGQLSARWIPVKGGEKFNPEVNLVRTRKINGNEITEVLIVPDIYNVTGDYIATARPGVDESGKPCVQFSFNSKGGQLFGGLTSDNRPSGNPEYKNQLGIILNGVMYSAPSINSVITDNVQITGNFTKQDVEKIVTCLNAGSLPVDLRKVEERKVETK